ncbi:hypothetical protein ACFLZW_04870 [Chloroflexota bacterium]
MCCVISALLAFGPRIALIVYWLFPAGKIRVVKVFDGWLMPILGVIFLPWTTLAFLMLSPVDGLFSWAFFILAFLVDLGSYFGGYKSRSDRD